VLAYAALTSVLVGFGTGVPDWIVGAACYAGFVLPVYLMHRRFSFRSAAPHGQALPRYVTVQAGSIVMATALSFLVYRVPGLPALFAAGAVAVATAAFSFACMRLWAFSARA
jgi:putative flippase GtrA